VMTTTEIMPFNSKPKPLLHRVTDFPRCISIRTGQFYF
jgi:hypothetical protein